MSPAFFGAPRGTCPTALFFCYNLPMSGDSVQTSVIYCGDCLDELKCLLDNCINLVTVKQLIDRDYRKELEYVRMLGGG